MGDLDLDLAGQFPPPDADAWRTLVDKTLKGAGFENRLVGRTDDGLRIEPLYTAEGAVRPLDARATPAADSDRPWDLRTLVDHADPARANADVLTDLHNGAASVLLRLDASGADGVAAIDQDRLGRVLEGVLLDVAPVALDAGFAGPLAANALAVLAKGAPQAPLAFHLDPITALAESGQSPGPFAAHLDAAAQTAARHAGAYAKASLFLATGRAAHEAGASRAQELGLAIAAALAYAKAMHGAGLPLDQAFGRTVLGVSLDADYFGSIAKLRAARALWARLTSACGVTAPARIEARSSRRMLSRLDPWVNLLRLTAAGFAGGVGGADAVVLDAFTRPLGRATEFARRQARNTQLVLMEEAHLGRVADPAGGAWFLESSTDALARAAWTVFQGLEAQGGAVAALLDGAFAREIAEVRDRRAGEIARRKLGLVGVSEFPNLDEAAVAVEPVNASAFAQALDLRLPGEDDRCADLSAIRLAEPFEALRARALRLQPAPAALLATLGAPSDYTARLTFTRNLLAAGGIAAQTADAADTGAGHPLVVLCSADAVYAEQAVTAAQRLKAAGVGAVWTAGRPGDLEAPLRAAGVTRFLAVGDDVIEILDSALTIFEGARA